MKRQKKILLSFLLIISILTNSLYYHSPSVSAKETDMALEIKKVAVKNIAVKPAISSANKIIIEAEAIKSNMDKTQQPVTEHIYDRYLTKRGGVYHNPYTGLKETWYSQRVLPGGGLDIPGRHVNDEGFVCDEDGYICVASSTYSKGAIIETSRGMGKVYDSGCAPGILDIYTNW